MGLPKPPIDLKGHCSAIYNDKLYIFSPSGFVSTPIDKDPEWTKLPGGVPVDGGVCANADIANDPTMSALYVVGGRTKDAAYPGLQRFMYASQTWETLNPITKVSQNRKFHGAAYIPDMHSIAMYGGSQDNDGGSSNAFMIKTTAPYSVDSFPSPAEPLYMPQMMTFNQSHALMVGGTSATNKVYLAGRGGWTDLGTTLAQPISDPVRQLVSLSTGADGSKVLNKYNLGANPVTLQRYLLISNGKPTAPGTVLGGAKGKKHRRQTAADWPAYDPKGAPSITGTQFSLAQDGPGGVSYITGGGGSQPVAGIFSEKQSSWVAPQQVFGGQAPLAQASASTPLRSIPSTTMETSMTMEMSSTLATTAATSSAAAASSAAPAPGAGGTGHAVGVLGAALGGVLGFALLLVLILLFLKRRSDKSMKNREHPSEKGHLSFADRGQPHMGNRDLRLPQQPYGVNHNNDSITSLQIFQGKAGRGHRRSQPSDASMMGLVGNGAAMGRADPYEMNRMNGYPASESTQVGTPPEQGRKRDPSWSQYFTGMDNVTNLGATLGAITAARNQNPNGPNASNAPHAPQPQQTYLQKSFLDNRYSEVSASDYGDSRRGTNVKPLDVPRFAGTAGMDDDRPDSFHLVGGHRALSSGSDTLGRPAYGNAFAANKEKDRAQQQFGTSPSDFPMPRAYLPNHNYLDKSIPPPDQKGPQVRKMTGDEDMSWLNINHGRPI